MRITFIVFTLVYLMDVIGMFTMDLTIMTIAYVGGGVLLFLPTVFVNALKKDDRYITITSISNRTNILALNAAIEAARAENMERALPWWLRRFRSFLSRQRLQ